MVFLNPVDNRQEALEALSLGMEYEIHGNYDYRASCERRALVFAVLDVAEAIRESNRQPQVIDEAA